MNLPFSRKKYFFLQKIKSNFIRSGVTSLSRPPQQLASKKTVLYSNSGESMSTCVYLLGGLYFFRNILKQALNKRNLRCEYNNNFVKQA